MKKKVIISLFIISFFSISIIHAFAKITVVSVKGQVAYKNGNQWAPIQPGMELKEGTKISTGIKSNAVIKLNNHTITVKPLTLLKIYESKLDDKEDNTRIGLRRGSVQANVDRSKRIHTMFKVSTPVATSSVRGTKKIVSYGPEKSMKIEMLDGTAEGESINGSKRLVYGKLVYNQTNESSEPESILKGIQGQSLIKINDRNSTGDEKKSADIHADEVIDNSEGPVEVIKNREMINEAAKNSAQTSIEIIWPRQK